MTRESMYKYTQGIYTYDFRIKICSVRLILQLFVGGGACLIYVLCVWLHIVMSNTSCVVFFVFLRLCTRCCQFLWIAHCWFSNVYITQNSSSRNNMKNTSVIMGEMAARNNSSAIVIVMTSCFDPMYESRQRLSHFYFLLLRYWSIQ